MSSPLGRQQASVSRVVIEPDSNHLSTDEKSLQQQAIEKARSSISKLPKEDVAFRKCASSKDGVTELIQALKTRYESHDKKRSVLVKKFHEYSAWLRNFSNVIDIAVQSQANFGCPIWAPLRFVLEVSN